MNVPYIGERSPWDALVETAYARTVDYLLRDSPTWALMQAQYPPVKLSRPQRLRRKLRNALADARYAVGHWVAGPCPDPYEY